MSKHTALVQELSLSAPRGSPLASSLAALAVRLAHVTHAVRGVIESKETIEASH